MNQDQNLNLHFQNPSSFQGSNQYQLDEILQRQQFESKIKLNQYNSPADYKNNFKIKIQSSKALQFKEQAKVLEIMNKIEKDKEQQLETLKNQDKSRQLDLDKNMKPFRDVKSDMVSLRAQQSKQKVHSYNYLKQQLKALVFENQLSPEDKVKLIKLKQLKNTSVQNNLTFDSIRLNQSTIESSNLSELRNRVNMTTIQKPKGQSLELQSNQQQQKQEKPQFTHELLRRIKQNLNQSQDSYIGSDSEERKQSFTKRNKSLAQNVNDVTQIRGVSMNQVYDQQVIRSMKMISDNKKSELKNLLCNQGDKSQLDRMDSQLYQYFDQNESQNTMNFNGISKLDLSNEDYLNNNVEYSFVINTFEDQIDLQKQYKVKQNTLQGIKINKQYQTMESVRFLQENSSEVNFQFLPSISRQQTNNLKQNNMISIGHLDLMADKNQYSPDKNQAFQSHKIGNTTMLRISEQNGPKPVINPKNIAQQFEELRKQLNPIFSGNMEQNGINQITETEIVKKGRKMSNQIKSQMTEDQYQLLFTLRFLSNEKITQLSDKNKQIEKVQQEISQGIAKRLINKESVQNELAKRLINCVVRQISNSNGPKPSSREQFAMCQVKSKYYIFGGMAQQQYNDLKFLDTSQINKVDWLGLLPDNTSNQITRRFGHTMLPFKDEELVIFGGGGSYITKIKRRETFNDIYIYNLQEKKIYDLYDMQQHLHQQNLRGVQKSNTYNQAQKIDPPTKRMGHAAAILGHAMVIQGGIYGEDNKFLDDFAMFDMISKQWSRIKQSKSSQSVIGCLAYHTMTTAFELEIPRLTMDSRLMWIKTPQQILNKETQTIKNQGIYIFGGLNDKKEASNSLYLLQPCYERNKKYISLKNNGVYKKVLKPKIYFELTKIVPEGIPPCSRYLHSACYVQGSKSSGSKDSADSGMIGYLAIFGGRNDLLFKETGNNIALNDLHVYDIKRNLWLTIAIYGDIPMSRWGHQLVSGEAGSQSETKMIIFGGINLQSYCDTSIFEFDFGKINLVFQCFRSISYCQLL
ncbi:kelch motif family protein [Stylonychia lemnae]|uniref:Kelch motif family protein n=1 Tax=Stylonychia lemnae TaxID=5949 RepID=A0A077ZV73_STYLE|nr:kelch motif family protein [Stylonychia lemnae]|eukprot:CDW73789.1 kelch motif family protein [Stylonychia lemnae]